MGAGWTWAACFGSRAQRAGPGSTRALPACSRAPCRKTSAAGELRKLSGSCFFGGLHTCSNPDASRSRTDSHCMGQQFGKDCDGADTVAARHITLSLVILRHHSNSGRHCCSGWAATSLESACRACPRSSHVACRCAQRLLQSEPGELLRRACVISVEVMPSMTDLTPMPMQHNGLTCDAPVTTSEGLGC